MKPLVLRSKLFVPGSRPELFAKAWAGAADAVSFDLEDSVPPAQKAVARHAIAGFLGGAVASGPRKLTIVRTNAPGSPEFADDLDACLVAGVDLLNLPKVESASELREAVAAIERIGATRPSVPPVGVLVNIETPRALRAAADIAGAHPRVAGLQLGLGDLFEPYGISRGRAANVQAVMLQVRLAAAEAGVVACDGAYADIADAAGFEAEARMARDLGFIGKSCIHPRQVALANAVFEPTADEVSRARRIVDAARGAAAGGRGAFVVDGAMVDAPFVRRAEAVLLAAARLETGSHHVSS